MGFLKDVAKAVGKATSFAGKTIGKAVTLVGKASEIIQNPIKAASNALTSGQASQGKATKKETQQMIATKVAFSEQNQSSGYSGSKLTVKQWFMQDITLFGVALSMWQWLLIPIILAVGLWYWLRHKKRSFNRRRTSAARRARGANRARSRVTVRRRPARRKK
jgi:hypothetical protein